jgi:glutathione peroxidase
MRTSLKIGIFALAVVVAGIGYALSPYFRNTTPHNAAAKSLYEFTVKDIDGQDVPLSKFKGKVIMVVNVASKCGNTPQYKGLEQMYEKYKDQGLVILGFPANNFAGQEPGSDAEIKEFCSATYAVKFPMFSKVSVKGDDAHPLYQWLIASTEDKSDVDWNFAKFLVGRDGKVLGRFKARIKPDDIKLISAVESALAAKG